MGPRTCSLSYFTLVCLWCGRTVARSVYGHVITKFSGMGRLPHFLSYGASRAGGAPLIIFYYNILFSYIFLTRHPPPVTRYPSPATRYPPPATRHPPPAIRHLPPAEKSCRFNCHVPVQLIASRALGSLII